MLAVPHPPYYMGLALLLRQLEVLSDIPDVYANQLGQLVRIGVPALKVTKEHDIVR